MASTQLKTLIPGVVMRSGKNGRTIRFACMVNGTRFTETVRIPVDALVDERGRPTRQLKDEYNTWRMKCEDKIGVASRYGLREPTLREMITTFERFANERRLDPRFQRPCERTISTAVKNFHLCVAEAKLSIDDNYTKLYNEHTVQRVFDGFIARNLAGVSAWSYILSLQSVTATWTAPQYERNGYLVHKVKLPDAGLVRVPKRYSRPSKDLIDKQDVFYASMQEWTNKEPYLVASMALHLAMRPNDIGRLTSENFFTGQDGRIYLHYTPEKTKNSSKRTVTWPIPKALWQQIREYAGDRLDRGERMISSIRYVSDAINPAMRLACGMEDSTKALYEFRKRCIDYVYHHYGINAAVAISGDQAHTIEYYYYDPSMTTMAPEFMTVPINPNGQPTQQIG